MHVNKVSFLCAQNILRKPTLTEVEVVEEDYVYVDDNDIEIIV